MCVECVVWAVESFDVQRVDLQCMRISRFQCARMICWLLISSIKSRTNTHPLECLRIMPRRILFHKTSSMEVCRETPTYELIKWPPPRARSREGWAAGKCMQAVFYCLVSHTGVGESCWSFVQSRNSFPTGDWSILKTCFSLTYPWLANCPKTFWRNSLFIGHCFADAECCWQCAGECKEVCSQGGFGLLWAIWALSGRRHHVESFEQNASGIRWTPGWTPGVDPRGGPPGWTPGVTVTQKFIHFFSV